MILVRPHYRLLSGARPATIGLAMLIAASATPLRAEQPIPDGPPSGGQFVLPPKAAGTTVIERGSKGGVPPLRLVALLTADGQQIDQGLVWRVFQTIPTTGKSKLVTETREASPSLKLPPGDYTVNAAFGRANLTRKVHVAVGGPPFESFVLNAGGLRVAAIIRGKPAPAGVVTYSIFSDDRDQSSSRTPVMSGAKPNLIIRLNSGIYRIVSQYGDANAKIETDVTVEAGKLTETSLTHTGGKATFKLVTRSGGEAMPDTRWTIQNTDGEIVKESVGALPTHILAPGKYVVIAASGGQLFKNAFEIKDGDVASVEVMMATGHQDEESRGSTEVSPTVEAPRAPDAPSLDFKNQ